VGLIKSHRQSATFIHLIEGISGRKGEKRALFLKNEAGTGHRPAPACEGMVFIKFNPKRIHSIIY